MNRLIRAGILLAMTLSLSGCLGYKIVDTGRRGVRVVWGKAEPEILTEGAYFYNPFSTTIVEMDTRTELQELETETYTKDVQQAKLKVVINYNLDKDKAAEMYQNVGQDWQEKLIPQTLLGTVKTVIGKWDAVDLISNRAKAQTELQNVLTEVLATKDVTVTRVEITNIDYTPEFEKAVEEKVAAIQNAEKEKNNTVGVQERAKQDIIKAETTARAMTIQAQALSQNKSLVEWEAVKKWDGKMPITMLGNTTPFINVTPKE